MPWPVHPNGLLGAQGDQDTYRIERSLRFNSADSAYLSRTPASAGNRKTWTWSGWVKLSGLGTNRIVFGSAPTSTNYHTLYFTSANVLQFEYYNGSVLSQLTTSAVYRDVGAWYHIVAAWDTSNATSGDRSRLYINGERITSFSTGTYPAQNTDGTINNIANHGLGVLVDSYTTNYYLNGYLTEINFIDGQALTPSSFGETDAITGRWKAKAFSGTYGTNGFYLNFADNSGTTSTTLGKDSSGNSNNWTPNNFSVTAGAGNDSLVDSPTNYGTDTGVGGEVRGNYATLNVIDRNSSIALVGNGNLEFTQNSNGTTGIRRSSIGIISGKWYFEATPANVTAFSTQHTIGIIGDDHNLANYVGSGANGYAYRPDGNKLNNSTATSYGTTTTSNTDVIMVAFDADNWKIWFGKNGTWFASGDPVAGTNTAFSSITGGLYYFAVGSQHTGFGAATWITNFGQRPFAYTAPTGFKALCTTNFPTPSIKKPSTAMDVVTYTGTGSALTPTSSLGFSPDLVWIKGRSGATDHALYDSVRGAQARLESNNTDAEVTSDNGVTSFDSAGFTLGTLAQVNTNAATYVGWAWDAGSSNVTNNSGSITSTVRADATKGFSIVSFVNASGTNQGTVGHGLGVAPKLIISKNRDTNANNWAVFHSSVCDTTSKFLQLNTTAATQTFSTVWGANLPTSSVFGVTGGGIAAAGVNVIAYCFSEIEGYSRFGSYTGNGSADGPFVWCGFRPRWILFKSSSVGGAGYNWGIYDSVRDTFNAFSAGLFPNLADAEVSSAFGDMLSNGFKIRNSSAAWNSSGQTYIFAAFAESPFKYARAG